jgi:hypothetical protein
VPSAHRQVSLSTVLPSTSDPPKSRSEQSLGSAAIAASPRAGGNDPRAGVAAGEMEAHPAVADGLGLLDADGAAGEVAA